MVILTPAVGGAPYPTTLQGLEALIHNPHQANWKGPYVRDERMPTDAWGNAFRYLLVGGKPDKGVEFHGTAQLSAN